MKFIARRSWRAVAALSSVAAMATGVALADTVVPDGDTVVVGVQPVNDLGMVAPGATVTTHTSFSLACGGGQHLDQGKTLTMTFTPGGAPAGGTLSATNATIGPAPAAWPDDNSGGGACTGVADLQDNGDSTVTITAPTAPGSYTYTVTWSHVITPTNDNGVTGNSEHVTYTLTVPSNTAPTVPGKPALTAGSLTPNRGAFSLGWTASTDAQGDPITYTLQHKDANDASFSNAATALGVNSFQFLPGPGTPEGEGTWTYQVSASDGSLSSAFSPVSDPVKVDRTNPTTPTINTDRAPDYSGGGGWFKDSVTLHTTANGDPALLDGSVGSGVDASTIPADATRTASTTYTATVKDNAGNESSTASKSVQVDASNPDVSISGCPATVGTNDSASINVTASDTGSGLQAGGDPSGTVTLGTGTAGTHTKTVTATDNVGHSTSKTCTYLVDTPPSAPGTPSSDSNPDKDGVFTLSWSASSDAEAGDTVTYRLERKPAGGSYSTIASGLSAAHYAFTSSDPEHEGTFGYRVIATDGTFDSAASGEGSVKVDRSAPGAPSISADRTPEYSSGADDWFRDHVTLSFAANGDPALADGTAGSGVDPTSVPADQSQNTTGALTASGTVKDNAGNESASASKTVNVDADAPDLEISACPDTVRTGASASITVSAADVGSGLVSDPSGPVTLDTTTAGQHTKTITVTDHVGHSTTKTCTYVVDTPPSKPGVPAADSNPNKDGVFTLSWSASSDAEAGDTVTYRLERKASVGSFSTIASGLTSAEYHFTSANPEHEGTFAYRVIATDGTFDSATSDEGSVKVDESAPLAPTIHADRAPEYTSGADQWFKDQATLTFADNGDPDLADGTAGSGVDPLSVPSAQSLSTTGDLTATGTVKDYAGNESASASRTVKVDADAPVLHFASCPSPLRTGSTASIDVTASDVGSGLVSDPSGTVVLDTSTAGLHTKSITVSDLVGHSTTTSCEYLVDTPPTQAGRPQSDSNPDNDGLFTLSWAASTDAENNAITYTVERKAQGGSFTPIATGLTATQYAFTAGDAESEGTFSYRVIATDGVFDAPTSDEGTVKVDKSAPYAPSIQADRAPEYTGGGDDWFKDHVTLSFSANGDPALGDGTAASGVDPSSVPADQSQSTTGALTASGTVKDNAGNESASASKTVNVDAAAPTVSIDCPAYVRTGDAASASWHAADVGSGLTGPDSGSIALDTEAAGTKTASVTVHDHVGHDTTKMCTYVVDTPPSKPGAPAADANPNKDGVFTLNWTASTDAEGDDVTYTVLRKPAGGSFATIASGLTSAEYHFTSANPEHEGTFAYRVIATDGTFDSATSDEGSVKVDKSAPNAPTISADRVPEYTGGGDDWFKGQVTLSFSANGDPNLSDGTLGSGVDPATVPAAVSRSSTGSLTATGTVKDLAGNESASASKTVKVDADAPSLTLAGCPTAPVRRLATLSISATASDVGSGLASAPTGSITLETSTAGSKTKTVTATDQVGNATSATCIYSVYEYGFAGFFAPIQNRDLNGTLITNVAKAGSAIPVKFRLTDPSGPVTSLDIVAAGSPTSQKATCNTFAATDPVEETVTAGGSSLTYDPVASQYVYVWKTDKTWVGQCRQLDVKLNDGTSHVANFSFTR
jgi:hypothetical protein